MQWTPEAETALKALVPAAFLNAARGFVEDVALELGCESVTNEALEEAKKRYFESM
jgi:hypothetical protein